MRFVVEIGCRRLAESSDSEQSDAQAPSGETRPITLEEMGMLLRKVVLNVQVIKAKVDVLIADCGARPGLEMASRGKSCWACGQSRDRDTYEESQNPCSFC